MDKQIRVPYYVLMAFPVNYRMEVTTIIYFSGNAPTVLLPWTQRQFLSQEITAMMFIHEDAKHRGMY